MKFFKIICLIFFAFILQYCALYEGPYTCTAEFATYSITVLNPTGESADSVDIKVIKKENGKVYPCDEYLCRQTIIGRYTIMHDGFQGKISRKKESFIVEGIKNGLQFREEFVFRNGECHVEKLAGPDTVFLSSN